MPDETKRASIVIALSGLTLGACMTFATKPEVYNAEQVAIVRKQAAFDMSCPEDKLQILEITKQDSGKVDRLGAVGCDKKGAYVRLIDYNGTHWVLDSAESKK